MTMKAIARGALGRNGGSDGACEPHVSLTHEPELNRDWKAGWEVEMCCMSFPLAAGAAGGAV